MTTHERDNLLNDIAAGWGKLQVFITTLSEEQLTGPTDAAGWTVKDHLIHLAVWETGLYGMLHRQHRWQAMEVDQALWEARAVDQVNAAIQQRHRDLPLRDVLRTLRAGHERLVAHLQTLTDDDLQRPYSYYQPGYDVDAPIINWVRGNTHNHYAEHMPWMAAIAGAPLPPDTVNDLLARIEAGWNDLQTMIAALTEAQLTGSTDAAGWTVKDHLVHLADWETSVDALLQGKPRWETMGLPRADWDTFDIDHINDIMQKRSQGLTLAEARQRLDATHAVLLARVGALDDADLMRPYSAFEAGSTWHDPVLAYIIGNSFGHYAEHMPWMTAIVEQV